MMNQEVLSRVITEEGIYKEEVMYMNHLSLQISDWTFKEMFSQGKVCTNMPLLRQTHRENSVPFLEVTSCHCTPLMAELKHLFKQSLRAQDCHLLCVCVCV